MGGLLCALQYAEERPQLASGDLKYLRKRRLDTLFDCTEDAEEGVQMTT